MMKKYLLRFFFLIFCLIIQILLAISPSSARTWYIKSDGSGDAPTIRAGVDSSAVGDTVLVSEGTYVLENGIRLKGGVCIISEKGPYHTKLVDVLSIEATAAFWGSVNTFVARTEIIGFWIDGFTTGITIGACENIYITNNIFTGNECGIFINLWGYAYIENNTFYGNTEYAIDASDSGQGLLMYNIVWGRAFELGYVMALLNDFMYLSDSGDYINNFSQDPEFCGPTAGNFFLQSDSPCAPSNAPLDFNHLLGALPIGCGTTDVQSKSWGEIKAIFSE